MSGSEDGEVRVRREVVYGGGKCPWLPLSTVLSRTCSCQGHLPFPWEDTATPRVGGHATGAVLFGAPRPNTP